MTPIIKERIKKGLKIAGGVLLATGVGLFVTSAISASITASYIKVRTDKSASPASLTGSDLTSAPVVQDIVEKAKLMAPLSLKDNRVIQLFGEVNADTAKSVVTQLGKLNKENFKPITLIINSPGGSVLDGALIVDAIESSPSQVNTLCVQMCASMAAFIHQYGHDRLVLSHSILMFHPAFGSAMDDIDRMVSLLTTIQRYTGKMEATVAKRAGLSFQEYKRLAARQIWIDGEDAVSQRLADKIVYVTGDDVGKLFEGNLGSDKTKGKNGGTRGSFGSSFGFKQLAVTILTATVKYLQGGELGVQNVEKNFGDNPPPSFDPEQVDNAQTFYKNTKVGW